MHVTMIKKRLANGEACGKCEQAEELLRARGLRLVKLSELLAAS